MTPSPWTDDRVAALRRYWREGLSARQVAERLGGGLTRCAVLGKLHRLQAGRRASPSPPGARSPDARSPGKVALPRSPRDGLTAVRSRSARPPRRAGPPPEDGPGLASVLSIGSQACRWPIGDPKEDGFALCGRPVVRGAYCAAPTARRTGRGPTWASASRWTR